MQIIVAGSFLPPYTKELFEKSFGRRWDRIQVTCIVSSASDRFIPYTMASRAISANVLIVKLGPQWAEKINPPIF